MKRNIFLIGGVLLAIILMGGVGFYFINKNNKPNLPKEDDNSSVLEKLKEKEKENYNYLTYVPIIAYSKDYIDVLNTERKYLLGYSLDKIMMDKKVGDKKAYLENTEIDAYLEKMYNIKLSEFNLDKYGEDPFPDSMNLQGTYVYNNAVFNSLGFRDEEYVRYIASYHNEQDNLIIDEYILKKDKDNIYKDMFINKDITIDSDVTEYIKNNLNNLTKYEHTFKKNETGYYWFSTEVINDIPLKKTYNSKNNDNYDNRGIGKVMELNEDIKSKTLDFNPNYCLSQPRIEIYKNKNYYPTIWSKFDYAVHKLIESENITSCPMDYSSLDCYFDLARIKPYYIKYFGSAAYSLDVNSLINYTDYNPVLPIYKDNKYFLKTACGEVSGLANYYEEVDKVIEVNDSIEVYVRVAFISYLYNDNLVKQLYYRDNSNNNLIYETSYFNRDDNNSMISNVIPSIRDNLATYKYILSKEGDNYYFDHVERIN